MSDRQGKKALFLEGHAKENRLNFIRFDYFGHGDSDGEFHECGLDDWLESALLVIDNLTSGKVVLVGSSLGGWLSHLVALRRPDRVLSLLSLAPAPDFTEDLMWDIFSDEVRARISDGEIYNLPSDYCEGSYPISQKLIESGRKYFLLREGGNICVSVPMTIIHGMDDNDVPYEYSLKIINKVVAEDAKLVLLKGEGHSLSSPEALEVIGEELGKLVVS